MKRDRLRDNPAEPLDVQKLRVFGAVAEGARRGENRILQLQPGGMTRSEVNLEIRALRHSGQPISARSKTGPSRQTRRLPLFVGTTQPRQTPTAHPMCSSIAIWVGNEPVRRCAASSFNMGTGPQAQI